MVQITIERHGWYWTPDNELRACMVGSMTLFTVERFVIDTETGEIVDVPIEDVMIEKPDV